MGSMKKVMMTFRISDSEKNIIEENAKAHHMSISQYIRHQLSIYNLRNTEIQKEITMTPEVICNILTEIQKIRQLYPNVEFEELEERVAELCRS